MDKKQRRERRLEAISIYKRLSNKLEEGKKQDAEQLQQLIKEDIELCAELYPLVKRKLDGTAADSRHMRNLVRTCYEASKQINVNSRPFELNKIIKSLMQQNNPKSVHEFHNFILENHVSTFLKIPPTFEYFYGALKSEPLVKKEVKTRRVREKLVETKAITAKERNVEQEVDQDSTPKEVEHIEKEIVRLATDSEQVGFFEALVDPKSFTQTVENLFHTSFLIKEGKIGIKASDSDPILTVEKGTSGSTNSSNGASSNAVAATAAADGNQKAKQSILSFTMETYRDWISSFDIKKRAFSPRNEI